MTQSELRAALLEVSLVKALPRNMRRRMAMIFLWTSESRMVEPGEHLYEQGAQDESGGLVLVAGSVEIVKAGDEPEVVVAPDILGEIQQFMSNHERTATVTALDLGCILTFSWQDLAITVAEVFTPHECEILRALIAQMAWGRCAELFDQQSTRVGGAEDP